MPNRANIMFMLEAYSILLLSFIIYKTSKAQVVYDDADDFARRSGRIAGGHSATPAQFPFAAFLKCYQYKPKDNGTCSGSVIGTKFILTAAHCLYDDDFKADYCTITLGSVNIRKDKRNKNNTQVQYFRNQRRLITHPCYTLRNQMKAIRYDIGIVILDRNITSTFSVHPIELDKYDFDEVYPLKVTIIGYGDGYGRYTYNRSVAPKVSDKKLRYIITKTIKTEHCDRGTYFDLLCVLNVYKNESTCHGDSGGPVVHYYENNDRTPMPIQVAITSGGGSDICDGFDQKMDFVRITTFYSWIHDTINGIVNKPQCYSYLQDSWPNENSTHSLATL